MDAPLASPEVETEPESRLAVISPPVTETFSPLTIVPDTEPPAATETVVEPTMVPLKFSPASMLTAPLPTKTPEIFPPALVRISEPMTPETHRTHLATKREQSGGGIIGQILGHGRIRADGGIKHSGRQRSSVIIVQNNRGYEALIDDVAGNIDAGDAFRS
jgi:hypothetical protein